MQLEWAICPKWPLFRSQIGTHRCRNENEWGEALARATGGIEIAPGRPLSDSWFPRPGMSIGKFRHAPVRAAAQDWPAGHKLQEFSLLWVVKEVDDHAMDTWRGNGRVEVVARGRLTDDRPASGALALPVHR